ncbi:MAG: hypothetical protein JRE65_06680, partial [Deltaproteobacteria bacterium]|nr:hypothetical protein [Deltaproteobacteria bacterium]
MRFSKNHTVNEQKDGSFSVFTGKHLSIFKSALILLFFTAITFAIYSQTFDSPFVLDDLRKIEENPHLRVNRLSPAKIVKAGLQSSRARPIAFMTFALNYSLHQYDVFGYHLLNISIHVLTGFFLYLFLKATFRIPIVQARYKHTDLISFFAALIWLIHPIQTQSVTYIVQRANSLAALFFMLSILFYACG